MLHTYRQRINRIVHYRRYWKEATRKIRAISRAKRTSIISKVMAAIVLNSTVGCVQVLQSFRAIGWFVTGSACSLPTPREADQGLKIIEERMTQASPIMASRDGHYVSLRSTVEMDIFFLEQTPKTSKCDWRKSGREKGIQKFLGRAVDVDEMESDDTECRGQQESMTCKVTWDSRA
jgi:hypothetical protein